MVRTIVHVLFDSSHPFFGFTNDKQGPSQPVERGSTTEHSLGRNLVEIGSGEALTWRTAW